MIITYIINFITILLGFIIFLSTIGHMMLIIFVALPITRTLEFLNVLKSFRARSKKYDIIFDGYFLTPLYRTSLIIILITLIFFFFINNFFQYLIIGYILGVLMIIFNFFIRKTYGFNKNSFRIWYLGDHGKHLDLELLNKMKLDDEDKLFHCISTWVTPEGQKKIKQAYKKINNK